MLALFVLAFGAGVATADLLFSIGVRETDSAGPVGADGGTSNGIEFIGIDSEQVAADGLWHEIVFDLDTDPVTAFAGATANGILETTTGYGVFEHLRIRNVVDGVTHYRVWVDAIVNTVNGNPISLTGFEGFNLGDEVVFQEPRFSGSTMANLQALPNVAEVSDLAAFEGTRSCLVEFDFVDDDTARWVRLQSFQTPNLPNPQIAIPGAGGIQTSTLSLRVRVEEDPQPLDGDSGPAVPTTSAAGLLLLGLLLGAASLAVLRGQTALIG